jgi:processive 1,2-diacylglycerol beta-glucosyltransferase
MSERRPILILTASAGAGHNMAARALEECFRLGWPQQPVEVHDVLESASAVFRRAYSDGYMGIVRHVPALMGFLYDMMDRPQGRVRRWPDLLRKGLQDPFLRGTVRYILRREPRLLIHTHFLPAEITAQLRRAGRLHCPQYTVTTDFETFRLWVQSPTERYFVATDVGRRNLLTLGVQPDRVVVSGIPVRAAFQKRTDRSETRRRNALDPERPVVLLLCGGLDRETAEALFQELMQMPRAVQVVVVAGNDGGLRRRLEARGGLASSRVGSRDAGGSTGRIRILGFTDRMHEWMTCADLVVTKPGGLTSSEALVCGLPLVLVRPIPGNETRNADYLLEHAAAIKVNHARLLGWSVQRLLGSPRTLGRMHAAAQALARPDAAGRVMQDARDLLAPALMESSPAVGAVVATGSQLPRHHAEPSQSR